MLSEPRGNCFYQRKGIAVVPCDAGRSSLTGPLTVVSRDGWLTWDEFASLRKCTLALRVGGVWSNAPLPWCLPCQVLPLVIVSIHFKVFASSVVLGAVTVVCKLDTQVLFVPAFSGEFRDWSVGALGTDSVLLALREALRVVLHRSGRRAGVFWMNGWVSFSFLLKERAAASTSCWMGRRIPWLDNHLANYRNDTGVSGFLVLNGQAEVRSSLV